MSTNTIEIILKGTDDASDEVKKLGSATEDTGKKADLLTRGLKAATAAVIAFGAKAVIQSAVELFNQGKAINQAEKALEGYVGGAKEAEKWTKAIEQAGMGALSSFDATTTASRFAAMGLASNSEEAAKLTKMAVTLGAAMGKDAAGALEDFSLMLANQSIPRLDTFGISGAEVRKRMEELSVATGETDRQLLFLQATMEIGTTAMDKLNDSGFKAVDSTQRLAKEFENMKNGLAGFVADRIMPIFDGFYAVKDAAIAMNEEIVTSSKTYEEYKVAVAAAKEENLVKRIAVQELTEEEFNLQKQNEDTTEAIEDNTGALELGLIAANDLQLLGLAPLNEELANTTVAVDSATEYMQKYSAQLIYNELAAGMTIDQQIALGRELGLLDDKTIIALEAMQKWEEELANGSSSYEDIIPKAGRLNDLLQKTPKNTDIKINTYYTEYYEKVIVSGATGRTNTAQQVGGAFTARDSLLVGEMGAEEIIPSVGGMTLNQPRNYYYNMTINEAGGVVDPYTSFRMLRALAG